MSEENDDTSTDDEVVTDGSNWTDKTVNDLIARKTDKAATKAVANTLAEHGLKSVDELKALVDANREREDAERSDVEKAQAAAAQAAAERDAAVQAATRAALSSQIQLALGTRTDNDGNPAAVRSDRLQLALGLALDQVAALDDEDDPVQAAVEYVAGASPEWFGPASNGQDDDGQPSGNTGRRPPVRGRSPGEQKPKPKTAAERGRAAAAAYGTGGPPPPFPPPTPGRS